MANTSILAAFERMWQHITSALSNKSDISHDHNDMYYTETEVDTKISDINTSLEKYVDTKVADMVDSAPETLNTLNELAAALGDDPNFATTIATQIGALESKVGDVVVSDQITDAIEELNLPAVESGQGEDSMVIGEGNAVGQSSMAGGTTDKQLIENIVGSTAALLLPEPEPAQANGDLSISLGAGTITHSAGAMAMGVNSQAGCLGYYMYSISGNTIELGLNRKVLLGSRTKPTKLEWAVGDVLAINNGETSYSIKDNITITAVDTTNMTITVDTLPFTELSTNNLGTYMPNDLFIYVPAKPDKGEIQLGFGAYAHGYNCKATGVLSTAFGYETEAYGMASFVTGRENKGGFTALVGGYGNEASGSASSAVGRFNNAIGSNSHAQGKNTTAYGDSAHAEGHSVVEFDPNAFTELTADNIYNDWKTKDATTEKYSVAFGNYSHVEGQNNLALGGRSHAEGWMNTAQGVASHAEGRKTVAKGEHSHSEGKGTIASGNQQHVEGRYNVDDTEGKYAHIVGNGTSDTARSNAYALDWDGNAEFAGDIKADGIITGDIGINTNGTYLLGTFDNFSNGHLIEIGASANNNKVVLKITGHGYGSAANPNSPINSIFQFFDYDGSGGSLITRASGLTFGTDIGVLTVYRHNGKLYAHIPRNESYQTYSFELLSNKTDLAPRVTNATAHTSEYEKLITITPKVVATKDDINNLIGNAPDALNTLNELANALNDDENFATTVTNQIAEKSDKAHTHKTLDVGTVGSEAHPIYFENGAPVKSKYDLAEHDLILDRLRTVEGDIVEYDNAIEGYPLDVVSSIVPVQSGSGEPSPDNIRPISGHTAVKLTRGGKNLFNPSVFTDAGLTEDNGVYSGTTIQPNQMGTLLIDCKENTQYTLSFHYKETDGSTGTNFYAIIRYTDDTSDIIQTKKSTEEQVVTLTSAAEKTVKGIAFTYGHGVAMYIKDFQFEIGTTATAYEPYRESTTFTMDLGQTVYGGSLDWATGVLTIGWADVYLDETANWNTGTIGQGQVYIKNFPAVPKSEVYCDKYPYGALSSGLTRRIYMGQDLNVYDVYTTAEEWLAHIAENPIHVVYQIPEPITIQLTAQEITALDGTNYLFSDTGKTSVKQDYIQIDKTLTKANSAADAKVVGDRLDSKYEKPSTGIPSTDLALDVQESLAAVQNLDGYATRIGELESKVGDDTVSEQISSAIESKADTDHTHSYNDLTDKPTIPSSLPANGGNADTVDGKHADEFASASVVAALPKIYYGTTEPTDDIGVDGDIYIMYEV